METLTILKSKKGQTVAVHAWKTGWQELAFADRAAALQWATLNNLKVT